MHIFFDVKNFITKTAITLFGNDVVNDEVINYITCEPPRDNAHGDIATNIAMVLAKPLKSNPRIIAEKITNELAKDNKISSVEVAGAGFINIKLTNELWFEQLQDIFSKGDNYGSVNIGKNHKVNVEYVSANPTGPMHIGHARGAVYGDALCRLLRKAGFDVTSEYYINDAGSQIDTLTQSALLRYKQAMGENIGEIPKGLYPGDYLVKTGEKLKAKFGEKLAKMPESQAQSAIRQFCIDEMMELITSDLQELGIKHDVFSSEKKLQDEGKIEEALDLLKDKNLLYKGVLEPPKGKQPDDWEAREQLLFKSTDFGDDVDRALQKSDGSYTYFASDIAYHLDKYRRGFNDMVVILGADHGGYVKRIKAAVKALSNNEADIDCKISQMVNFVEDGKAVKMSKRAGTFTTVKDVIDAVGSDVVSFIMMTRKNDAILDFDLNLAQEQSKDNPVFYVQYANARANSVIRHAKNDCPKAYNILQDSKINNDLLSNIKSDAELELIKFMARFPRIVELSAKNNEPHRIAFYLQELAANFHSLWNKGKDDALMRFILPDNVQLTAARLAMLKSLTYIIASGLNIFNIKALQEMN